MQRTHSGNAYSKFKLMDVFHHYLESAVCVIRKILLNLISIACYFSMKHACKWYCLNKKLFWLNADVYKLYGYNAEVSFRGYKIWKHNFSM